MKKDDQENMKSREQKLKKVIVVMPAFNAELTLEKTYRDIPEGSVDEVILTDYCSLDATVEVAERLGITVIRHDENRGYGANQKTCYASALEKGADVVVMIHPDYQYDSRLIPYALGILSTGVCDVILGQNLGDFHSGFRVYTRKVLETIPYQKNSDDFVFDTEFLAQAVYFGFKIGDIPIPCRYFKEASSINFIKSTKYGFQTLGVMGKYIVQKLKLGQFKIFLPD